MIESIGILTFIFGTIMGSFLNVVAFRLHTGRGLQGRSMCDSCGYTLAWFDLVPVASFMALGGRCRKCSTKLSYEYPTVEVITGFIFASFMIKGLALYGLTYAGGVFFFIQGLLWSLLIVILIYDFKHMIIPERIVWVFISLAFLFSFVSFQNSEVVFALPKMWDLFAGPLLSLPFLLIWFFSKGRAFGFGDVKLSLGLGWMLGLSQSIGMFFLAFWIGGIVSVILMLYQPKRFGRKTQVPFAPFLIVATFFVSLFSLSYTFFLNL